MEIQSSLDKLLDKNESVSTLKDRQKSYYVAELVKDHQDIHIRAREDNGELLLYEDGIWTLNGEQELQYVARESLGKHFSRNVVRELKTHIQSDPDMQVSSEELGLDPGYLAVENGLLDLQAAADGKGEDALRPLEPDDYALTQLPVEYDPDADAGEWTEFVQDVVEPSKVETVQEYVGYTLDRGRMPYQRALLLIGSGRNGKTTFLNTVRALLGGEHTTSVPIRRLGKRFALPELEGSLANIHTDLSSGSLSPSGISTFKELIDDTVVTAERKHEQAFEFRPDAKHLYACNQTPDVSQYVDADDLGFWRRWILVDFPNEFPEGSDRHDPNLLDRLTADEVLSGVLNWAIDGWDRLMKQGGFTNVAAPEETRRRWQNSGDSADKFIAECVERDPDAPKITTGDAYERYRMWCDQNGEQAIKKRSFTERLKQEDVEYRGSVRVPKYDNPRRGYRALGFTNEVPQLNNNNLDESSGGGTTEQTEDDDKQGWG